MTEMTGNKPQHVNPEMSARTRDSLGIGNTQGQRAAEIICAIRAMQLPSPETDALARFGGRLFARVLLQLAGPLAVSANLIGVRTQAFYRIVKDYLADKPDATLVELAAGFSPRGVQIARDLPSLQVIEIDLPDVLADKQRRLKAGRGVVIPPNIEWRDGDLANTTLDEVLAGQQADMIVMEGLLPYFNYDDCLKILQQAYRNLKPGGQTLCDILYRQEMQEINRLGVFSHYRQQAGSVKYHATSDDDLHKLFQEAGYTSTKIHHPTVVSQEWNLISPVKDYSFFCVGQRAE